MFPHEYKSNEWLNNIDIIYNVVTVPYFRVILPFCTVPLFPLNVLRSAQLMPTWHPSGKALLHMRSQCRYWLLKNTTWTLHPKSYTLGSHFVVFGWGNLPIYFTLHHNDVIKGAIASQITSIATVYSTVNSGWNQRKHQSSASLAFVPGIHRDRWIPRTNGQ